MAVPKLCKQLIYWGSLLKFSQLGRTFIPLFSFIGKLSQFD